MDFSPLTRVEASHFPAALRKQAVVWEDLAYNVAVQDHLMTAIMHGCDADWIWQADSDERVDFACVGGLKRCLRRAGEVGADYVPGHWIDRVSADGFMPKLSANSPLGEQFPAAVLATRYFQTSLDTKVALHRRSCLTFVGNHRPKENGKVATGWSIPIWHFKWHSECPENQATKIEADHTTVFRLNDGWRME